MNIDVLLIRLGLKLSNWCEVLFELLNSWLSTSTMNYDPTLLVMNDGTVMDWQITVSTDETVFSLQVALICIGEGSIWSDRSY